MNLQQFFRLKDIDKSSLIVLIIMLFLTIAATYFDYEKSKEKQKIIFENSANEIPSLIEDRMKAYRQVLLSGVAKFYTSKEVTRENWKEFVEALKLEETYPGLQGMGFSLLIKKEDKEKHIAKIRAEGFKDYDIKPAGDREIYTSIIYLEPFDNRNKRAFGYDMFSEKIRNEAMQKAIETGIYSLSGKVRLLQENGVDEQAGFLAYIPVYKQNMLMTTSQERLDATYGFVYAPFRMNDLINSLASEENSSLDIMLYDGNKESKEDIYFDLISDHSITNSDYIYTKVLAIGGREWFVKITPKDDFFEKTKSNEHYFMFVIGTIFSLFLFILINIYSFFEKKRERYYEDIKALGIRRSLALKAATIGTWEWKYSDNSMVWDNMMYEIYGVKETINLQIFNVWKSCLDVSSKTFVFKNLFKSKRDNSEHNINFWIITPTGEKKYIHSLGVTEFDSNKKPISMIGINIDITEYEKNKQQLLEQNLLIQEQKVELETIFNYSKDAIAIVDLNTNFLFFNDSYLTMTGFSKDELLTKSCLELLQINDLEEFQKILKKAKLIGFWENFEATFVLKDSKKIQIIMSIVLLPDKKRFLVSSKNLTELKKKEQVIKNYVKLIDKHVITSTTNLDGIILSVSQAFCNVSGYSKEELIGQKHSIVKHPNKDDVYKQMWKDLSQNKTWKGELHNIRKDRKEYWVRATISPIFNDDGVKVGYTAIREDITDKKIIEEISIRDGLTNIYNRRYFNELLPKYIQGAKRKDEMIGFIILDVDFFKQYNDNYGHQKGDDVLINVASILKNSLGRIDDYCFRLGGEEFGVAFKVETKEKAWTFANLLRQNIEDAQIEHLYNKVKPCITVSMGLVCSNASEIEDVEMIYKKADLLLYRAKENGRNQVQMDS